jgi:hypothetical protein
LIVDDLDAPDPKAPKTGWVHRVVYKYHPDTKSLPENASKTYGNRWTRERVTSLRSHHRIAVYEPAEDGIEPWLNLSKAARLFQVSARTLRFAAEDSEIEPFILCRTARGSSAALFCRQREHALLPNPRSSIQDTPRDHIPISKTCSQRHRHMGVVMRGCSL